MSACSSISSPRRSRWRSRTAANGSVPGTPAPAAPRRHPREQAAADRRRPRAGRATRCRARRPTAQPSPSALPSSISASPPWRVGSPVADLVAAWRARRRPARTVPPTRRSSLSAAKRGPHRQQPEAGDRAAAALDLVVDPLAEHLVAAADAEDRVAARPRGAASARVEPAGAQPLEVLDGRLRTRHEHEVGALDVGGRAREAHAHPRLGGQRVDVGEVAHPAQPHDGDLERVAAAGGGRLGPRRLERERVLDVQPQARPATAARRASGGRSAPAAARGRARGSCRRRGTC